MKKLELKPTQSVEIDWSKPQWVQSLNSPDFIILTTGKHTETVFCGTVLPCAHWPNGCDRVDWNKEAFKPLEGEIPFIISNND